MFRHICRFCGLPPAGLPADGLRSNSSSGKRSAAGIGRDGSSGAEHTRAWRCRDIGDGVERQSAGGNAGATPVPTTKSDPMPRPAAQQRRRCLHSISRSARRRRVPIGLDGQWTIQEDAICAQGAAPLFSYAAPVIVATATARGDARRKHASGR